MANSIVVDIEPKTKGVQHDIDDPITLNILMRLKNIEGQVRGIHRMVEEDQYCIDILTQVSAVRSALNSVGMKVLRRHIDTCVTTAIQDGGQTKDDMIDELMTILGRQKL